MSVGRRRTVSESLPSTCDDVSRSQTNIVRSISECDANATEALNTNQCLPTEKQSEPVAVDGTVRRYRTFSGRLCRSTSLTELKYRGRANVIGLVLSSPMKRPRKSTAPTDDVTVRGRRNTFAEQSCSIEDDGEGEDRCWSSAAVLSSGSLSDSSKVVGLGSYGTEQKLTLLCLALIHFGVYLSMSIIAPFFPIEAQLKGLSLSITGWIFSSYALVMFLVSPFMGKLICVLGVKFTLISGLFLASGCNILFGTLMFINDGTLFMTFCFVLRSVEAIGATAFFTAAWTIVAERFPDDISYVFGLMETCVGIGMTVGPAIGGALYSLGGYQLPFYSLGSFMMTTVPICIYILPDPPIKNDLDDQCSIRSQLNLYRRPGMFTVCLAVTILLGIWGFLDPTLEPHLREFGVTPQTAGFLFLFMAATYSMTCPLIGRISDKWECERTLMFLGLILTAISLVIMGPRIMLPFIPSELRWNVLAMILLGITIGIGTIPTFQLMLDEAYDAGFGENPATYGMVSSIFSATSALGEFLGPAVGGVLYEYYSFDMACTCIGLVAVATASILVMLTICSKNKLNQCCKPPWSAQPYVAIDVPPKSSRFSDSGILHSDERTPLLSSKV